MSKLNPNARPYIPQDAMDDIYRQVYRISGNVIILQEPNYESLERIAKQLDHSTPPSKRQPNFEKIQIERLNAQTGLKWMWNPFDSFYISKRD